MSQWHRDHPELVGTYADPWMIHEDYRRLIPPPEGERENNLAGGSEPGHRPSPRPGSHVLGQRVACEACGAPEGALHASWCDLRGQTA